ncbi:unnamed protein product [Durusdinium trenchii]|uniref:Ubiquitin-like domain-containing protein n=1 Tax=Durusdinium trenchii TaxID=1381693 RepID=A0ABP0I6V2_9DINO
MAGLGSRRGPFKPGDVQPNPVRPPMCLPPMSQRSAKAAPEPRPLRRDKAHEERLVLESALAFEPVSSPELPLKLSKVQCHEGSIPEPRDSDRPPLRLRLRRKGVTVAEVQLDPSMTVQELKEGVAAKLDAAPEDQRFFWRMQCLPDYSSLQACGLVSGEHDISVIPELSHHHTGVPLICARRGLNMVPSGPSLPWRPSKFSKIRHEDLELYFGDAAPLAPLEPEDYLR